MNRSISSIRLAALALTAMLPLAACSADTSSDRAAAAAQTAATTANAPQGSGDAEP